MGKELLWISCAVMAMSVLSGCDKGPSGPYPPELGEVTASQERIGVGHQIVLTVEDKKSMSGSLYSINPVWTINGNEILDLYTDYDYVDGKGKYTCYYVPMNVGTMEVALNVELRFNDAPAGKEIQNVSVSGTFDVVRCDARSSFWGDSVEITMYREPGLVRRGSSNEYIGEGTSSILGIATMVPSVDLTYVFENGGLVKITEEFNVVAEGSDGYKYVAQVFDFALRTLETEYAAGSVSGRTVRQLDTDRSECMAVANMYRRGETLSNDEMALLGEGLVKGWVSVSSSMSFGNTGITFTSEALPTSNSVDMVLIYTQI